MIRAHPASHCPFTIHLSSRYSPKRPLTLYRLRYLPQNYLHDQRMKLSIIHNTSSGGISVNALSTSPLYIPFP
jgi:hypothetical protein